MDDISYLDPESIGGLNLYTYCGNNPISRVDPNGNSWWKITLGIFCPVIGISMLVGGAISAANGGSFADGALGGGFTVGASIGIIAGLVATTILTGGTTAGLTTALGGGFWAAVGAGAIVGGVSGAIMGGGFSLLTQGISSGYSNINWGAVGKSALIGGITGAIFGGVTNGLKFSINNRLDNAKVIFKKTAEVLSTTHRYAGGNQIIYLTALNDYNLALNALRLAQSGVNFAKVANLMLKGIKLGLNNFLNSL